MSGNNSIQLRGALWMVADGYNLGGSGRIRLLSLVDEHGSITHAAKAMKMSYKAAWDAIDHMNKIAGEPLVERIAGGKGGGTTYLTERGRQLIANFRLFEQEHRGFVDQLSQKANGLCGDLNDVDLKAGLQTSNRNQFAGTVAALHGGVDDDEIEIELGDGQKIRAQIDGESTRRLALKVGKKVTALIPPSALTLDHQESMAEFPRQNTLAGKISGKRTRGGRTEIEIELPGEKILVASLPAPSDDGRRLELEADVYAHFDALDVIVGV